jgi:hypothetical protein
MDCLSSVLACCKRGEHDHDGDAAVDCCNVLWHGKSSERQRALGDAVQERARAPLNASGAGTVYYVCGGRIFLIKGSRSHVDGPSRAWQTDFDEQPDRTRAASNAMQRPQHPRPPAPACRPKGGAPWP